MSCTSCDKDPSIHVNAPMLQCGEVSESIIICYLVNYLYSDRQVTELKHIVECICLLMTRIGAFMSISHVSLCVCILVRHQVGYLPLYFCHFNRWVANMGVYVHLFSLRDATILTLKTCILILYYVYITCYVHFIHVCSNVYVYVCMYNRRRIQLHWLL